MRLVAVVLVSVVFAVPAYAQHVHKCTEKGKTVYQSAPCSSGVAAKTWEATPDLPDPYRQARLDAIQRQLDRRKQAAEAGMAQRSSSGGSTISARPNQNRCEAAKAQRDATYDRVGVRRTFDLSRRLDDMVYEACK
jgi:hypothetical protein